MADIRLARRKVGRMARKKVKHRKIGQNKAYQSRKPYRNSTGRPSRKWKAYVRTLEAQLGREPVKNDVLNSMSPADLRSYTENLKYKINKQMEPQRRPVRQSADAWRWKEPTSKQLHTLQRLGYEGEVPKSRGKASDLIGELTG